MSETAQDSQGCSQHLWGGISILLQQAFPWLQFEAPWTAEAAAQPRSCPFVLGHCCTQLAGATPKICRAGATQVTKSKILTPKLIKILTATLFSLFPVSLRKVLLYLSSLLSSIFRCQAWGLDHTLNSSQAVDTWAMEQEVGVSRTSWHQFTSQSRPALH